MPVDDNVQQNDQAAAPEQYYILAQSAAEERTSNLVNGDLFAVFGHAGQIGMLGVETHGLYFAGTRHLSKYIFSVNGKSPHLLSTSLKENNYRLVIDVTNADLADEDGGLVKRGSIHFFRSIFLKSPFLFERVRIENYALTPVEISFGYEFGADYRDIFEIRGVKRKNRGHLVDPTVESNQVHLQYLGLDQVTRYTRFSFFPNPTTIDTKQATFKLRLRPHEQANFYVTVECSDRGESRLSETYDSALKERKKALQTISEEPCVIETSNQQFNDWLNRSTSDLFIMLTDTEHGLYPYAGVPWYATVFGRDGLITAMEALWAYPNIARGVLAYLARHQSQVDDPARDAEIGKILHEQRKGEMANLGEIPFGNYYGSIDSTLLFLMLAGYYYKRTCDLDFIKSIWHEITRALEWMNKYADLDGDGFIEYKRRSASGLIQQGWKDSDDAVFHKEGKLAEAPVALCEVQGYAYAAKLQAAKLAIALGKKELAQNLLAEAHLLKDKFQNAFWCEEINMYALALDGNKEQCCTKSSNAGQCLFTGIAHDDHAQAIIDQLLSETFSSGWGIRTIAESEIRYNPMSYHNGSIWPHDNALIAYGMHRYGRKDGVIAVLQSLFNASVFMNLHRLPELYCGFPRRASEGPTLYPVACNPQAWASSAILLLLQSALGIDIDAHTKTVYFAHPRLPPFLKEVLIKNLRIGNDNSIDLWLRRHHNDVSVNVVQRTGDIKVTTFS